MMLAARVLLSSGNLQVNPVRAKRSVVSGSVSGLSQIRHCKWFNICNTLIFSAPKGKKCVNDTFLLEAVKL